MCRICDVWEVRISTKCHATFNLILFIFSWLPSKTVFTKELSGYLFSLDDHWMYIWSSLVEKAISTSTKSCYKWQHIYFVLLPNVIFMDFWKLLHDRVSIIFNIAKICLMTFSLLSNCLAETLKIFLLVSFKSHYLYHLLLTHYLYYLYHHSYINRFFSAQIFLLNKFPGLGL